MNSARTRRWWTAFLLGVGTTIAVIAAWSSLVAPPAALAQVPDSGAQRQEMIKELRESNRKLMEIAGLLREIRDDARRAQTGSPTQPPTPQRP